MFIDQREFKEEWYDGEFTIEELNEELFDKMVAAYYDNSSGMGGPGVLRLLTEDNVQYAIGMDMMKDDPFWSKVEQGIELSHVVANVPVFDYESGIVNGKYEFKYKVEGNGWTPIPGTFGRFLVRDDYVEVAKDRTLPMFVDSEDGTHRDILYPFGRIGAALGLKGLKPKCYIYKGTKEYRINMQKKWEEYEAERKRLMLTPEDVEWKPIWDNNIESKMLDLVEPHYRGEYMLLFRKHERYGNTEVEGQKWSIVPQWKNRCIGKDSSVEAYNLFCKYYFDGIEGPFGYPYPDEIGNEECEDWYTFNPSDLNDHGKFVSSHPTMEAAKEEALSLSNGTIGYGGFDKENLITEYPSKELEERVIFEKYAPIVALMENAEQIVKTICEYEMRPDGDRGGWAWQALRKELGYPEVIARKILTLRFSDIDAGEYGWAKERLKSIGRYDEEKGLIFPKLWASII